MIPETSKEHFEKAMQLIMEQSEKDLKKMFRQASLKAHPDKEGGVQEVFKAITALSEAVVPFVDQTKKPSNQEKINLAQTLRQLPPEISEKLINKIKLENPQHATANLMNPVIHTVKNTYAHRVSTPLENRAHDYEVNSSKFKNLKEQFQDLKGDYLKSKILENLKSRIENVSSKDELKELKKEIMSSDEYKVLNTGQGLFTKITGIKTSSVKALDAMINEQEQNLNRSPQLK